MSFAAPPPLDIVISGNVSVSGGVNVGSGAQGIAPGLVYGGGTEGSPIIGSEPGQSEYDTLISHIIAEIVAQIEDNSDLKIALLNLINNG